jgi:GDPmannose 4,6-dehydratase
MKALIFGSNGQDGYYLSSLLKSENIETISTSRSSGDILGDISNFNFVKSIINQHKPDYIFHFAANSSTNHNAIFDNNNSISVGTLNILESVKLHSPNSRVFLSGSAMQFANIGEPIDENTQFFGSSPYAVSRIHSTYLARYYRVHFGLQIFVGYLFNHDSPHRKNSHINQKIVEAVIRISKGSSEKLYIGDISVRKEFNFAGDIVNAIWKFSNQNKYFELIIGSGVVYKIEDWLEYCFKKVDLNWQNHVIIQNHFTPEYHTLISNPALLKSLGWKAEVDIYQLADMMISGAKNNL